MVNDVSIGLAIITFFIFTGVLLPFVADDLGDNRPRVDVESLEGDLGEEIESVSSINAFSVLFSVAKMFFWTFGDIPFVFDILIFTPLRIGLAFIIFRNIWIGGGA